MRLPPLIAIWLILAAPPVIAQSDSPPAEDRFALDLAEGGKIDFDQMIHSDDGVILTGPVTIRSGDTRIQADRVIYREERYVTAEGNVLLVWQSNRIFGSRLVYDLKTGHGIMDDASGQARDQYLFWAKRAEKIGVDLIKLKNATFTTCTQPTPYWSFNVSSATIRLDKYARMWNPRLVASKIPVFYLPYIVWPVKDRRAAGLLIPEFLANQKLGSAVTQQLFIPLGQSADVTLLGTYYTDAGLGGGLEARWLPSRRGSASFKGFYINDQVTDAERWNFEYKQEQQFNNGFRMVADINQISDFNYYSDFARNLNVVSSPTVLARIEFSRNGPWASLNVRELRREQLRVDGSELIQQTLPEIEWRGRTKRLGKSPVYFDYQSSVAAIQQREEPTPCLAPPCTPSQLAPLDADYGRIDVFPTFSMPLTPAPWLDITPSVRYRSTYWSQRTEEITLTTGDVTRVAVDSAITRGLFGANLSIVGPKLYRLFDRKDGARFKHTVEPRISYGYLDRFDRTNELLLYDDVDQFNGSGANLNYSLVQRLFAKRPRTMPQPAREAMQPVVMADGTTSDPLAEGVSPVDSAVGFAPTPPSDAPVEPLEIASLEFRQMRSFNNDLSFADRDGDGIDEASSPYSDLQMIGRFNPSQKTSIDVRGSYHILYEDLRDVTLSGAIRNRVSRTGFSIIFRNGLGVRNTGTSTMPVFEPVRDDTQLRFDTGLNLFGRKLQVNYSTLYTARPPAGQSHLPDQHWRVAYATQCCTFVLERYTRDFSAGVDRRDLSFRVDLAGIGKLFDYSGF
ncbi:MAG: LPS assembly protein LptD [Acidobacteria bacterium]|nr:LPS assembly protein LptD [Acidobacteriota bacterium]NIM63742.1 LPS assembly protein LptD [Acidobacteriota bacterium]NIO59311.1 LPS assembly protein LptD [Acidobacteriota bacterium]NIQ30325.1 LPS assembly protein LptD [Acidobacteriota bacterium]NIQ85262.1 LPS assembly protein LptD [Acidobacteriota bacterium]